MNTPELHELVEGYKAVYPAAITDILDTDFEFHNQWLGPDIRPLTPEMRVAGPAMTMRWVNDPVIVDDNQYEELTSRIVNEMKPFMVPVIDTSKCPNAGYWGELMCTIAEEKGISGAVIDGGVRDPYYIYKSGFNLFSVFPCPLEANFNRSRLESVQQPITINQVTIHPGDFIMGDFGGVVVIPQDIVVDVYYKVKELIDKESETCKLIRQGASVKELLATGGRI